MHHAERLGGPVAAAQNALPIACGSHKSYLPQKS